MVAMPFAVVPATELAHDLKDKWCRVQEANPNLLGPCFRPELCSAVARFHPDIFVAVLEDGGGGIGFMPFLRLRKWRIAKPVPLCDYQAIIGEGDRHWDIPRLLRASRLVAWDFHHLVGLDVASSGAGRTIYDPAPRVNLAGGFEAYLQSLKSEGKSLRKALSQRRLIERDLGSVRFEPFCKDVGVLHAILRWKADRYNNGRPIAGWVVGVLEHLLQVNGPSFSGVLSAVYAGNSLLAAHFGLRCNGILHYWFPGFNPAYAKYSPGWVLIHEFLTNMDVFACRTLDFGPGGEQYKRYLANAHLPTTGGSFELPSVIGLARKWRRRLEASVRSTDWLYLGLKPFVRAIRNLCARRSM
jgi:CelD/BcsL family acetyltransferase involved in cellulose biosynthesis